MCRSTGAGDGEGQGVSTFVVHLESQLGQGMKCGGHRAPPGADVAIKANCPSNQSGERWDKTHDGAS
jgi:hypothetical protein